MYMCICVIVKIYKTQVCKYTYGQDANSHSRRRGRQTPQKSICGVRAKERLNKQGHRTGHTTMVEKQLGIHNRPQPYTTMYINLLVV